MNYDEFAGIVYKYCIDELHNLSNDDLFMLIPVEEQEQMWIYGYHVEDIYQHIENLKELY